MGTPTRLTCPLCSRSDLLRLTKHVHDVHGLSREEFLAQYPGTLLEVPIEGREVKCSTCGAPVTGYTGRAFYVKCDSCRGTPLKYKKGKTTDSMLACQTCGLLRRRLLQHVQADHGFTQEQYLEQYPGALLDVPGSRARSAECRAKMVDAAKARWAIPGAREALSEKLRESAPWKGKHFSEEHKVAISRGGLGKPHNITSEDSQRRGERGRVSLAAIRERPGHSEKLSAGVRRRLDRGEKVGFQTPGACAKSLASRIANGTLIPQGGGRGICGFRKGIPHYTRSTLEANFCRVLMLLGIRYEYEGEVFKLLSGAHYTPEFYLHDPVEDLVPAGWVELKGWGYPDGTYARRASEKMVEFEAQVGRVFVLCQRDVVWSQVESRYAPRIPLWERPCRNLRTHPEIFGKAPLGVVNAHP